MSTDLAKQNTGTAVAKTSPAKIFRDQVTSIAKFSLTAWVGEDRAREAVGRVSVAINAIAASAKNPQDFYDCTPQSIASVVAISALTGIMPSNGAGALAYAIPRRPRKGESPQLQYQLSHRGINALASRASRMMIAVPVSMTDSISINECGEVSIDNIDPDNPPTNEADFRGILLTVKNTQTGMILARQWVSKKVINERREASDAYQFAKKTEWAQKSDPWHKWYVEQSIKTAMHYAVARGWCIIDDTESLRALSADVESDLAALPAPASQGASRLEQIAETLNPTVSQDVIETTTGDPVSEFAPGETEEPGKYVTRIRKAISVSTSADALSELIGTVEGYAGGDFLDSPTFEKLQALAVTRLKEIEDAKAGGKLL